MGEVTVNQKTYRIIPSRYPPIPVFENHLTPDELEVAYYLESLTNDRIRHEMGDLLLVPKAHWVCGPGTTVIMAAFTHIGVASRFTGGEYGVYYAGLDMDTALAEARHSQERQFRATNDPPAIRTMRCYVCDIDAPLVDLRDNPAMHKPDSWRRAQEKAATLRKNGAKGLLYRSVRRNGGECIAGFLPTVMVPPAKQGKHFQFQWNGQEIDTVLEVKHVDT